MPTMCVCMYMRSESEPFRLSIFPSVRLSCLPLPGGGEVNEQGEVAAALLWRIPSPNPPTHPPTSPFTPTNTKPNLLTPPPPKKKQSATCSTPRSMPHNINHPQTYPHPQNPPSSRPPPVPQPPTTTHNHHRKTALRALLPAQGPAQGRAGRAQRPPRGQRRGDGGGKILPGSGPGLALGWCIWKGVV